MPTPSVGDDIEGVCGRCGQTWHVVMAKVGDRIAKVVCKRCGAHHAHRTADGRIAADETPSAEAGRGSGRRRPRRAAPEPPPPPPVDPSKPARPYSARESYAPGDRVHHPSFGTGVVAGSPGPGKIDVAFPGGRRVLAAAKVASTLERPVAVANVPVADRPPKA